MKQLSKIESTGRTRRLVAWIAVAAIVLPVVVSALGAVLGGSAEASQPFLEFPDEEACVRDTTYMRFHHWELLRGLRDEAVRGGDREGLITLNQCRECHANRARFCNRCHEAVSLSPDCFHCHYYPEEGGE